MLSFDGIINTVPDFFALFAFIIQRKHVPDIKTIIEQEFPKKNEIIYNEAMEAYHYRVINEYKETRKLDFIIPPGIILSSLVVLTYFEKSKVFYLCLFVAFLLFMWEIISRFSRKTSESQWRFYTIIIGSIIIKLIFVK